MAISKILDFSAGSKFAIKLPQAISNVRENQNCDGVFFSVTPLLNLTDSLSAPHKVYIILGTFHTPDYLTILNNKVDSLVFKLFYTIKLHMLY